MTGAFLNVSAAEYHAEDAVSHSKLEVFRKRPALYFKRFVGKTLAGPTTAAFQLGRALHSAVLEPEKFPLEFATIPGDIDRRTKEGKARWELFLAQTAGKELLDLDTASLVCEMDNAITAHQVASDLLFHEACRHEQTFRAYSAALRRDFQCRIDCINTSGCAHSEGRPYVVDLKTCDSIDRFERNFADFGYHRQCGFYLPLLQDCGVEVRDFFFVAVEKQEPFGVAVYRADDAAIACGQDETVADLIRLAACYRDNRWPNTPQEVQPIKLPAWYWRKDAA